MDLFLYDRMATRERREPRECEWLLNPISLAIIRGNADSKLSAAISRTDKVQWVFFYGFFFVAVVCLLSVVVIIGIVI